MNDWLDGVKRFVDVQRNVSEEAAYQAGVDCARNGPNDENCHFRHFSHPSLTQSWERGKHDGAIGSSLPAPHCHDVVELGNGNQK